MFSFSLKQFWVFVFYLILLNSLSFGGGDIDFQAQPITMADGVQVYAIGDIDIYAVSPDFALDSVIQKDNQNKKIKIRPKPSRQLQSNYVGATPPRLPRSEAGEEYPFRSVHLIDGDTETYWRCRPVVAAAQKTEWLRIDLAKEHDIKTIRLIPTPPRRGDLGYQYGVNPAFPVAFVLQVSRDALNWETVFETKAYPVPEDARPREFTFALQRAKQIRLLVHQLHQSPGSDGRDHFSITLAEFEVLDAKGNNVALISRGGGVTVSSTDYGFATKRETNNLLWPIHYDLGLKWLKVGYFMDRINWYHVEREKGKYHIDPVTEAAIIQAADQGIEVVMTLCYGNPHYQDYGYRGRQKNYWEMPYVGPLRSDPTIGPLPTSKAIEGYANYCRFMVDRFRGKIRYFEIWNNPDGEFALEHDPQPYVNTVKAAVKAIRQTNPDTKIVLGGMSLMKLKYFKACFEAGLASLVDVIAWHPYRLALMPEEVSDFDPEYTTYADWVNALRKLASEYGFQGELHANEATYLAAYPQNKTKPIRPDWNYDVSELTKAKYLARMIFIHSGLDVPVFWNETWNNQHIYRDVGLLRNTYSAEPDSPLSPQPAYYVMRTCCTVLEGLKPADFAVKVTPEISDLELYTFKDAKGQPVVALWAAIREQDDCPEKQIDVTFVDLAEDNIELLGIDILNGYQQLFQFERIDGNLHIPKIMVRDYPLVVRLQEQSN